MDRSPAAPPPLPATRLPGVGSALGMIVLYFALQLAVGGVAALGAGFWIGLTQGHRAAGQAAFNARMHDLLTQPDVSALLVIFTLLVTAAVVFWLVRRWWPIAWTQSAPPGLGLNRPRQPVMFAAAVVCGLALPLIGSWLTQWLAHGQQVTQDIKQLGSATSLGLRIPLVLVVVSVGPLVEELLFRGLLLSALLRRMGTGGAIAVSSLLFGLVHLPDLGYLWYAVPALALLAAVLAWLRLQSGSLWPAVVAHGVNNLLAVVAWFVVTPPGV